jgi:hypothetical protein
MKFSRFTLLAIAAMASVGCQTDDGSLKPTEIPPLAFVRYINALPDTLATTVRFIDQVEFTPMTFVAVPFRGLGGGNYQGAQAGTRSFKVFTYQIVGGNLAPAAGNTVELGEASHNFEAGKYYTVIINGFARAGGSPAKQIQIIEDPVPTPTADIAVRAIHAGAGIGNVDIYVTPTTTSAISGAPAFSGVAFGAASAYASLPASAFAVRVTAAGSTTPLISAAAPAGVAGTSTVNPIGGATIPGTVITAVAFPASVSGSPAASSANPTVLFFVDRQPPRTAP